MHTHKKNPLCSIIIPVYNEEKMIASCLEYVRNQDSDLAYEIIVVDNGSIDNTSRLVQSATDVLLCEERKRGVGAARKKGTEHASGTYIIHIDADTRLPATYMTEVLKRFEADPSLVCLGGQVYYYDASVWKNFLRFFVHWGLWFFARVVSCGRVGPMGNNMTFKKEVYDKTRGFDTDLKYGEDMDLCRKLSVFGRIRLDMRLSCEISVRRFTFDRRLWVYFLNFLNMSIMGKSYHNELSHPDETGTS